jgi:hypothetical protein
MAVVTTIMTSPLFDWVMGKKPLSEHEPETSMKDAHPLI